MIVYWSILAWISITGIIVNRYSTYNKEMNQRKYDILLVAISISAVILLAGARSSVADTPAYIRFFEGIPSSFSGLITLLGQDVDRGFVTLTFIIKLLTNDYNVWFMVIAIISGGCVASVIYKASNNYFISLYLFVGSCMFLWMFNGIRQFLAASILFAFFGWIEERKFWKYMVLVLLLSTIHDTILIMIPVYFIVQGRAWNNKTIIFLVFSLVVIPFSGLFINLLDTFMTGTSYEGDLFYFTEDNGTNIIRVLVASIPTIISLIYIRRVRYYNDNRLNIMINMSIISSSLYIISSVTSGILLGRLPLYFELFNLVLLPNLIERIFKVDSRVVIYGMMIILYFAYFYFQLVVTWGGLHYTSDWLNIYI